MKKLIGFAMIAVMAGSLFAAEAAQYGWQKGAAANANRSAFFSKVGGYKTEAEREAAFVSGVSGVAQASFTAQGTAGSGSVTVTGVEADYLSIKNRSLLDGDFFDEDDASSFRRVAVLGVTTATRLFGNAEGAVGKPPT